MMSPNLISVISMKRLFSLGEMMSLNLISVISMKRLFSLGEMISHNLMCEGFSRWDWFTMFSTRHDPLPKAGALGIYMGLDCLGLYSN